jgi:hypothetical protein
MSSSLPDVRAALGGGLPEGVVERACGRGLDLGDTGACALDVVWLELRRKFVEEHEALPVRGA